MDKKKQPIRIDPKSEFSSIRYTSGGKNSYFFTGQRIKHFYVYSINETSKEINNSYYKLRYSIDVINDEGERTNWIDIVNAESLELQRSVDKLITV